jgi:DNA-binding transcriptional MerR regulator
LTERIKSLQSEGRTLSEIGRILGGVEAEQAAAAPTAWWQHAVADDVVVWTRADMSPWRTRQVRAAIGELARFLGKERKE